jgi:hypothetical protein
MTETGAGERGIKAGQPGRPAPGHGCTCASIKHYQKVDDVNRLGNDEGLAACNPLAQNQITKGQRLRATDPISVAYLTKAVGKGPQGDKTDA